MMDQSIRATELWMKAAGALSARWSTLHDETSDGFLLDRIGFHPLLSSKRSSCVLCELCHACHPYTFVINAAERQAPFHFGLIGLLLWGPPARLRLQ